MKISDYGIKIGQALCGINNDITDVNGVTVGQVTIKDEKHKTGVTVIIPCEGNVFVSKPVAAAYSLNGYGKSVGTIQIDELGTIETPIALTNTLNVGKVADALVEYTINQCNKDGINVRSINPVVGETNDSRINNILDRAVTKEHVFEAIAKADKKVEQGDVGAGTGTVCFGLKGGIGSSSRLLEFGGKEYTIGVLVQSNYGRIGDLMINGKPIGKDIEEKLRLKENEDKGSIMIIIGTDIPLTSRQLKRIIKRAAVGMIRLGSYMGHGSGDIFIGFSNGNLIGKHSDEDFIEIKGFPEDKIDQIFRLVGEATEEAILNSMLEAHTTEGIHGETFFSLSEFM